MFFRWILSVGVISLLAMPISAQFGVAGNRKRGTTFQDLNELAQEQGAAGGGLDTDAFGDLSKMQEMFNDPAMAKAMEEAMEQLSNMTPEQMQEQMQQVMGMLTGDDMMDNILKEKEQVLAQLEASGMVAKEDIARYKADPDAFEKEMKDAFGQMKNILSDGDLMKQAMEQMADPMLRQLGELMEGPLDNDKIEEVRLELLSKPEMLEDNPLLKSLFDDADFKESLQSEEKWREAVKKGQDMFKENGGGAGAAGVGEL